MEIWKVYANEKSFINASVIFNNISERYNKSFYNSSDIYVGGIYEHSV